ncbi:MAG: hypothetical protein J4452_00660 [Candidatus Aenigmarchaeota archaeon]|nr:hypothetical protein [Candidatus Aenigmarchaeota archaeon]
MNKLLIGGIALIVVGILFAFFFLEKPSVVQQPIVLSPEQKLAENQVVGTIDDELEQAIASITDQDVENLLLS